MRAHIQGFARRWVPKRLDASDFALWTIALLGALIFVWPLWPAFGASYLQRAFSHDTLMNIDDLRSLHTNIPNLLQGRDFFDTLYDSTFYFPQPRALVTSELQLLAAIVTLPLRSNPVLAHNLLLVATLALNCVAAAKCAQALGAGRWPRIVAGVGFAFSSYTAFESGRIQLLYIFPIPFAIAAGVHWARTGSTRRAVEVAFWLAALLHLCLYYAMYACIVLPFVCVALRLSNGRPRIARDFGVLGGTVALVCGPALYILKPYFAFGEDLVVRRRTEALQQLNDLEFFGWSDGASIWRDQLHDAAQFDSALFPGLGISALALLCLALAAPRHPKALVGVGLAVAVMWAPWWAAATAFWPVCLAACAVAIYLARMDRAPRAFPALAVLFALGLFLFFGPSPQAWGLPLSGKPYVWLTEHVSILSALRVSRRAGVLLQLTLCCMAALTLTRIPHARLSAALALAFAFLTYIEAVPFELHAMRLSDSCDDNDYRFASDHSIASFAELNPNTESHSERTLHRYQAGACGVHTSMGQSGVTPPVVALVDDAVAALPDRGAQAWLWSAGIHWVMFRGDSDWRARKVRTLSTRSQRVLESSGATFIELMPPEVAAVELPSRIEGHRVSPVQVVCSEPENCSYLIDHDETTRWTTGRSQAGNEIITFTFAAQSVRGILWSARGYTTDLPRGLRLTYLHSDGQWRTWVSYPYLSPFAIARRPGEVAMGIALEPVTTTSIRIQQIGRTHGLWLGATEIEVIRGSAP